MTILKDILEIRYASKKLDVDLEMACLGADDTKLLGKALLDTPLGSNEQIIEMVSDGVITGPLKIFGMKITSKG